jgi:hypothetical protein
VVPVLAFRAGEQPPRAKASVTLTCDSRTPGLEVEILEVEDLRHRVGTIELKVPSPGTGSRSLSFNFRAEGAGLAVGASSSSARHLAVRGCFIGSANALVSAVIEQCTPHDILGRDDILEIVTSVEEVGREDDS